MIKLQKIEKKEKRNKKKRIISCSSSSCVLSPIHLAMGKESDLSVIVCFQLLHCLQALEIDPNQIVVGDVKETLLARGDIKISMADYKEIEREIVKRMRAKFDTSEQGQIADATALQMVKEIYEPVIKAIDDEFSVVVEFR